MADLNSNIYYSKRNEPLQNLALDYYNYLVQAKINNNIEVSLELDAANIRSNNIHIEIILMAPPQLFMRT